MHATAMLLPCYCPVRLLAVVWFPRSPMHATAVLLPCQAAGGGLVSPFTHARRGRPHEWHQGRGTHGIAIAAITIMVNTVIQMGGMGSNS